jgi:hypothetical protein
MRVPGLIELDGKFFAVGHLTEIGQVRAHNGYAVGASQVGNTAASGRRRIRHDGDGRTLEQTRQLILIHVAGELDRGIPTVLFLQRVYVASRLRMVSPGDDQLGVGHGILHKLECFNHQFQSLVSSPLAERQDTVLGIATAGKIRIFGTAREHSMGAHMHIIATILLMQDFPISGHENRNRI